MKVAFFGTPEFALPSLEALRQSQHSLVGVVSAPDKPQGRGMTLTPPIVAQEAKKRSLPLLQPENLRDGAFLEALKSWNADAFAVVAFRILPEEVFAMPRFGAINLHASLLPAYRGAAPINWALWNGDTATGLTTFRIEKAVDTGNILKQVKLEIQNEDDAGSLTSRMSLIGANLLVETLTELEKGRLAPTPQDALRATPAPKITKEHCLIDWRRTAVEIHNQIRALSPKPAAFTILKNQTLKIFRTAVEETSPKLEAGLSLIEDQGISAGTGRGDLKILEVQLQGKTRMDTKSFLRGFRLRGTFRLNP